MFAPLDLPPGETPATVTIEVDGRPVTVRGGTSLAIALLVLDVVPLRHTAVSGAPRAPLCLMGACFDCLVTVDGRPNVQACMVEVRAGMRVQRLAGARDAGDIG